MGRFTQTVNIDVKEAMLARNQADIATLRLLKTELGNAKIAKMTELTDEEELVVIRREVKKRHDAAEIYRKQNLTERAVSEEAEAKIISRYLPTPPDEEVVLRFLQNALKDQDMTNTSALRGTLIKLAREQFGSSLDGQTANRLASQVLSE